MMEKAAASLNLRKHRVGTAQKGMLTPVAGDVEGELIRCAVLKLSGDY